MKRKQAKKSKNISFDNSDSEDLTDDAVDNDNTSKIKKKRNKINDRKLYKPPTASELNNLREADALFHSSLFRLQTIELLKEIQLKTKWKNWFDNWMDKLRKTLFNIPDSEKFDINDTSFLTDSSIVLPYLLENKSQLSTGVFKFITPTSVESDVFYKLGMCVGPLATVDVMVEIPKTFWQHNDFLNHRYFLKRAQYLSYLAIHLHGCDLVENMSYQYLNGDKLRPVLLLKPQGNVGKHFTVKLIPVPEQNSFKFNRFIPQRNNVRPSWYFGNSNLPDDVPTPLYNLTILNDLALTMYNSKLMEDFKDSEGIRDGVLMLKVWLHQRNLDLSFHYIIMLLISYLLKSRKIFKLMSSYQILRSVFVSLSQSSWDSNGLIFSDENSEPNLPALVDFHNAFEVVFVDFTGYVNICGHLSLGTYQSVKHEATLAIDLLNSGSISSFDSLFMTPMPFHMKFDHIIHLTKQSEWRKALKKLSLNQELLNNSGNTVSTISKIICKTLRKGLGQRAFIVKVKESTPLLWGVSEKPPPSESVISIGILLNQESCNNVLEKGPVANTQEGEEFRTFWGDKANLRRFQDGTICEAVLWEAESLAGQRKIPEQIVKHLLQKFFNISSLKYNNSQLDSLLSAPNLRLPKEFQAYGTGEEMSLAIIRSYDSLARQLRKLQQLPLTISAIQGISPVFRYAEVFPPLPSNFKSKITNNYCALIDVSSPKSPPFTPVTEVMIQLENSGKWPEDLDALQRVKTAFYLKISELLSKHYYLTTNSSTTHVDVLKDGFVFRLIIACRKEINLLNQFKTPDGMVKNRITEESLELESRTESLTQLTSALHGLQQQHVLFSGICRLAKRWIGAQLLSDHVPEVVTELLVAYQLLQPYPYIQASSVITGFLRFLNLIATFDWKTNVLIINMNDRFNKDELTEIQSWFTTNRTTLPPMCVVTPYEKHRSIWSWKNPSGVILHRLTQLAKASFNQLSSQINNPEYSDYKKIFRPPLDVYDVVIHLKNEQNPKLCFAIDVPSDTNPPECENYLRTADEVIPVVNYDPVSLYINELKASYDSFCLFFHDSYGGNYIGVVWKPKAFESRPFKVASVNGRKPTESSIEGLAAMVPDVESILEDFIFLGSGLVKSVKTKSERWGL